MYKKNNIYNNKMTTKEVYNQEIIDAGEYKDFLRFRKQIHNNYSFMNLLAVYYQLKTATIVAR